MTLFWVTMDCNWNKLHFLTSWGSCEYWHGSNIISISRFSLPKLMKHNVLPSIWDEYWFCCQPSSFVNSRKCLKHFGCGAGLNSNFQYQFKYQKFQHCFKPVFNQWERIKLFQISERVIYHLCNIKSIPEDAGLQTLHYKLNLSQIEIQLILYIQLIIFRLCNLLVQ